MNAPAVNRISCNPGFVLVSGVPSHPRTHPDALRVSGPPSGTPPASRAPPRVAFNGQKTALKGSTQDAPPVQTYNPLIMKEYLENGASLGVTQK